MNSSFDQILYKLAKNVQMQHDSDKPADRIFIRSIHGYNKEVRTNQQTIMINSSSDEKDRS